MTEILILKNGRFFYPIVLVRLESSVNVWAGRIILYSNHTGNFDMSWEASYEDSLVIDTNM